jgi:hypothetical protein
MLETESAKTTRPGVDCGVWRRPLLQRANGTRTRRGTRPGVDSGCGVDLCYSASHGAGAVDGSGAATTGVTTTSIFALKQCVTIDTDSGEDHSTGVDCGFGVDLYHGASHGTGAVDESRAATRRRDRTSIVALRNSAGNHFAHHRVRR